MMTMNCILTGKEVDYQITGDSIYYKLNIGDNEVEIFICNKCKNEIKPNSSPYAIEGLIVNKKFPKRSFIVSATHRENNSPKDSETIILENFLQTAEYPKTA